MPEGDTIHRTEARLRQIVVGALVVDAHDNSRFFDSQQLVEAEFERISARGKHLLMHFRDGRVLHSHMGMTGSWHSYRPSEPWRKPRRRAALSMSLRHAEEQNVVVVCFSPKTLELLSTTQFRRHPFLHRLGPDMMDTTVDVPIAIERFRIHSQASIGVAIMNQTIVSGIGNVYKSETLFQTKTSPFVRVGDLSDDQLSEIVAKAHALMQQNRWAYPRRTRWSSDGQHLWVYGRKGLLCFDCGTTIQMRRQGDLGRSTYWCPICQES